MRILFVHQNFPAQFKSLAPNLAINPRYEVTAFTMGQLIEHPNIRMVRYQAGRASSKDVHPWVAEMESKVIRGEAAFRAALQMRQQGYVPDVIIAHPGWGESLFLKQVWPTARLGIYCEFFYLKEGADVGFDPEFPASDPAEPCRIQVKNVNNLMHFEVAQLGLSPTHWQASTFPQPFRSKISVIHDGIDTLRLTPNPNVSITLGDKLRLSREDEIITFVNRNLEPYRGFHTFMRGLPELMARRPKARILIIGKNEQGYGGSPPEGSSWREIYLNEVKDRIDMSRVHFLGPVEYPAFIAILQLSTVHTYLTYPFVLSWSLLEAMSIGCAIVASDTQPVREAITHGDTGRLFNFFDSKAMVDEICALLEDPEERARLGARAREFAQATYDLRTVCLPQQFAWVEKLANA